MITGNVLECVVLHSPQVLETSTARRQRVPSRSIPRNGRLAAFISWLGASEVSYTCSGLKSAVTMARF